jgi:hypothetical protein
MRLKPVLLPLVWVPAALAQQNTSLPSKEALDYRIEWRLVTAGKAHLDWSSAPRGGWQVGLHLESAGMVSKFYKVQDDYSAILNQSLCALSSQMEAHEAKRWRETKIAFDAESHKATYLEQDRVKNTTVLQKETDIPACVHDVVGGLYMLRTMNLEPGQSAQAPMSDGRKSAMVKVEAQQREDVKVPEGTFKTIRYEVGLFNNVLYNRSARLYIWLTDDRRKLPVQIRVRLQFTIGTITLQLEKHE